MKVDNELTATETRCRSSSEFFGEILLIGSCNVFQTRRAFFVGFIFGL